jgi:hypothetical protein
MRRWRSLTASFAMRHVRRLWEVDNPKRFISQLLE